jgi:hypothetical protein
MKSPAFCLVRHLPSDCFMNIWQNRSASVDHPPLPARHQFVIGQPYKRAAFHEDARLYYCIHCRWSFFVWGSRVAVLDDDGTPLVGEDSIHRFKTFEDGPCPVLEAFASAAAQLASVGPQLKRQRDQRNYLASRHLRSWPRRARPLLRVLSRLREDSGT